MADPNSLLALAAPDFAGGGVATYAWAFGQGVLVDLTPCVYPLIPITVAVFGAKGVSRGRALFLASAYVLGMAVLYTSLGVAVALSGAAFGAWLGNPWVVYPIVAMLLALSASMFGAFDIQLPTSMQNRLNAVGGTGPTGAFLMGLVSGLLSAPCTGPVLFSLLAVIASSSAEGGGVLYGGSLLFAYALGMGTLFFAVALGASLFRPGAWMENIKSFFGVAMLVMAAWFLRPVHPQLAGFILDPGWGMWAAAGLIAVGVAAGAVHLSFKASGGEAARKGVGVALAAVGGVIALNNVLYVPPMDWEQIATIDDMTASIARAEEAGKPIVIDFAATWCVPCGEMEVQTFHHDTVEPRLAKDFHLIKVDVTDPTDDQDKIKAAFHSGTLPSVLVYSADAKLSASFDTLREGAPMPKPAAQFSEFVPAEVFLEGLDKAE
jgi:thiol:disulfide interchange protein DsbD